MAARSYGEGNTEEVLKNPQIWPKYPRVIACQTNWIWYFLDTTSFYKILQQNKFEGADFKYDKRFLKYQLKITQIKYFLCRI